MPGFRIGLMDSVMAARPTADAFSRANYLAAVASRVDSYWVPDHINGQTPRPLWDPKYTAAGYSNHPMRRWRPGRYWEASPRDGDSAASAWVWG